jgi:DNA polymerase I
MILAIDTETTGLDYWHGCRCFLVTMCDGQHNYYFAGTVDPYDRSNVTFDQDDLEEIQHLLDTCHAAVFHNSKFDLHMLAHAGINVDGVWEKLHDTLIMSHCLSSGESHGLKYLAFKYMDYDNEDEELLEVAVKQARLSHKDYDIAKQSHPTFPGAGSGAGTSWWKMDYWLCLDECVTYGLGDVERTWGLYSIFYAALHDLDLMEQYKTRMKLVHIAYKMECVGYYTYTEDIKDEILYLQDFQEGIITQIRKEVNLIGEFNPNKPEHLSRFLFNVLELSPTKYTEARGTPSLAKDAIDDLIKENPNVKALQLFKKYKIAGTQIGYLSSYLKWICADSRIRATVFITGTRETRQAYRDPNLQNIDKRLRHLFGPPPGKVWLDFDLVNIELRIWVYQVKNKELVEAFNKGESVHLIIAKQLYPKEFAGCEESGIPFNKRYKETLYQWVKNGNFAIIYGATESKADETYRLKGAYALIAKRFPEVPAYTASVIQEMWDNAEQHHWPHVTCLGGYKLDVPTDEPFVACNYKIQGSAGWIIGEAMINIDNNPDYHAADAHLVQQVHDSLVIEVDENKATPELIASIKKSIEAAGLKYIPTCEASYDIIHNTQPPF